MFHRSKIPVGFPAQGRSYAATVAGMFGDTAVAWLGVTVCELWHGDFEVQYLVGYNPSDLHGISRVNPLITGVITHLLSGMSHQVDFQFVGRNP